MSDLLASTSTVVTHGSQSATGGTCFLDLPLELRTMIYDLSIPKHQPFICPLPDYPKPKVKGINLLQSCRQIRQETVGRVWNKCWDIWLPLREQYDRDSINISLALSHLHDSALAQIFCMNLFIEIDPTTLPTFGPVNLQKLAAFKSLKSLHVLVNVGTRTSSTAFKVQQDLEKTVFLTGLVTQILPQVPKEVIYLSWHLQYYEDSMTHSSEALKFIAEKYKYMQGSDCKIQVGNNRKDIITSP
ncbi:hypothetical protein KCU78_g5748, partial [Aureobasidium melanogenum]